MAPPFMIAVLLINVDEVMLKKEFVVRSVETPRAPPRRAELCSASVGDLYALLRAGEVELPCVVVGTPGQLYYYLRQGHRQFATAQATKSPRPKTKPIFPVETVSPYLPQGGTNAKEIFHQIGPVIVTAVEC